jgi:hypothetical protein
MPWGELGEEGGREEALELSELEGLVWRNISVGREEEIKSTHGIPSRPAKRVVGLNRKQPLILAVIPRVDHADDQMRPYVIPRHHVSPWKEKLRKIPMFSRGSPGRRIRARSRAVRCVGRCRKNHAGRGSLACGGRTAGRAMWCSVHGSSDGGSVGRSARRGCVRGDEGARRM